MGTYLSKDGISYLWAKIKNKFYIKPSGGIPKSDLASSVQASLGKADSALQSHQDISGKQDKLTAGTNITISGNTISAIDTTYSSKAAVSGGTDVSLVTTGEKAIWNAKTSNVGTITGIKMNGASKGTSGVVDLGTVITAHQDISGKQDKSTAVTHTANTAVGSATKPVYVAANGVATAITHSINADVPANAKFTDTTYSDATQSAHGLMTAADKKKLDGMDLSKYLPLAGGMMSGNIDMMTNVVEVRVSDAPPKSTPDRTLPMSGVISGTSGGTQTDLPKKRSFIGSYSELNGKWNNMISVRHRNGYNDGTSFGMYLRSVLTEGGSIIWNKQTAANTWQGERVLLDSTNYSNYVAPLTHYHRDLDQIGNVGYYGSDNANTAGWYKIYSGKITGYSDQVARLSIVRGYFHGHGTVLIHLRCNNTTSIAVQNLLWETRYYFNPWHFAIKTNGNEYGLYVYQSVSQYGCIKVRVLESCSTSVNWTMTLSSNYVKETSFTPTATATDGSTVALANALSTARTITIGSTGKSFDGSAAVSWSLDEIGTVGRTTKDKTYTFNSKSLSGDATSVLFNDYSSNQAGGGTYQSVFGNQCKAFNGNTIFVTGWKNTVQGHQASGFGENNNVNGEASSAFGTYHTVTGNFNIAFCYKNTVTGTENAAFGCLNNVSGTENVAVGFKNTVNGKKSFATGEGNTIGTDCTGGATIGNYNTCNNNASLSGGWYSYVDANQAIAYGNHCRTSYASSASFGAYNSYTYMGVQLTLGNGTDSARANAFRAAAAGVYSSGSYHTSGADYAEYFEWLDGNPGNEDRRGRFVKLDGEKILLAESIDDDILGIVSGNPSVVGDSYEDQWQGQYLTDIYGDLLTEDYTDEDGTTRKVWVLNPDYNPDKTYIPRSERKEWNAVGMMGKLIVVDDGTCELNKYCVPTTGGIATLSEGRIGYRVLSRVDETHIRVLVK